MRTPRGVSALLLTLPVLLAAPAAADTSPAQPMTIGTALPPGENGLVTVAGQAQGTATGDYGPHTQDQRVLYWDGRYKDGRFAPAGPTTSPRAGVRISRDPYGVPAVYGDTSYDTWWGSGWTAGQDRLFLADAVRHLARGTYGELVGPSGVPVDVQTRTLTYSQADYDAMFAALPAESRNVLTAYAAGLNAYIQQVRTTPSQLPAEYALLSTVPADWTVTDTLAAGVLITRTVAASGGDEFREIGVLRTLQASLGDAPGRGAFSDLRWQQDDKATVTVPAASGRFANNAPVPADQRDEVFRASATYALSLPASLATGPGTGDSPVPDPAGGLPVPPLPAAVRASVSAAVDSLMSWGSGLHGGSYMFTVSGSRTSTGKPMLVNGPQLGYTFPSELYEQEVHGGGYDARGVIVPGLPTIGIGYGKQVAWGLTTGYSKTIDSFIETTRTVAGRLQYLHDGAWRNADCRTETIRYRGAVSGVPVGPAAFSKDVRVCRTVHGPVVATTGDGSLARSVQYAMYGRELENVNGILQWDRADTLAEFEAGVRQVTWNENVMYAGADGHIAFWHPGLYPVRSAGWDARFPAPGTGEHDRTGFVPFARMPHAVDPAVGYLANWNNKPAAGWVDDYLDPSASRSAGKAVRVQTIQLLLAAQPRLTPAGLRTLEYTLGTRDQRAPEFLPLLRGTAGDTPRQRAALALLAAWDGTAYGPGAGTSSTSYDDETVTDGPAPTLFRRFMDELRDEVLADLPPAVVVGADDHGSHLFDGTPADNLVLRVLRPSESSLTPSRDYLHGRSARTAVLAALDRSIASLTADHGSDPTSWRDRHPRSTIDSLTGVIGPSRTMPFEDRGSWVQVVSFNGTRTGSGSGGSGPPATPGAGSPGGSGGSGGGSRPVADGRPGPSLAATGPSRLLAALGAVALLAGLAVRRRRA
jgi:penicillin G amidase